MKWGTIKEFIIVLYTTAGYTIDGEKAEFDEDVLSVAMILQEIPEEFRRVAMEQVKVLGKLELR